MEVFTVHPVFIGIAIVLSAVISFILGRIGSKQKYDGTIFVERTEDPNRDRVRFVLNLDLDEIRKCKNLNFEVRANESQNSQLL